MSQKDAQVKGNLLYDLTHLGANFLNIVFVSRRNTVKQCMVCFFIHLYIFWVRVYGSGVTFHGFHGEIYKMKQQTTLFYSL